MRTALRGLTVTTAAALALSGLSAVPAQAATTLSCPTFVNLANEGAVPVSGTEAGAGALSQAFSASTAGGPGQPVPASGPTGGTAFSTALDLSSVDDGAVTVTATGVPTFSSTTCATTKDTVAPAAPTGLSATSTNASQSSSTVGGTAEPGSTVSVTARNGSATSGPVTATASTPNGSFTVSVPVGSLGDGTITFTVSVRDAAGNPSATSPTVTAPRDATRPAVTGLTSTNTNAAQRVTTVTGSTEVGASVALSATTPGSSSPVTGSATATDGTFTATLDLTPLADGPVTVTATATDTAVNTGDPATAGSTKDTAAPTISGLAGTAVTTANGVSTITGTVSEAGADVVLTVSDGTTTVPKSLTDLPTTTFSTTMDLSSLKVGNLTLSAIATDAAGNTGGAAVATISKTTATSPSPTPTTTTGPTPTPTTTTGPTPTPTQTGTPTPTPTGTATPGSSAITNLAATNSGPSSAATVVTGATGAGRTVTVTLFNAAGDTATGSATAGSTGSFSVTVDLRTFRTSTVTVTAVSRDSSGQGGAPATTTLQRNGVPAAPSQPGARAGDASVRVLLVGAPFDNGSALTGYRAVASPGGRLFTAPAGATSILAQGLTNGVSYTFVVTATNARGESSASPATPAVTPRFATVLSVNGAPSPVVAGSPLRLTGSLKRKTSGAALIGFRVTVKATFDNGASKVLGTVATNSSGVWVLTTTPTQNATYTASYAGRPQDAPTSASRRVLARTKVTLSAPSGSARSALVMSGTTSPNKRGAVVKVYRVVNGVERLVAQATVSSTGTYRVAKALARGTYVLVARIGPTTGNTSGSSPRVTTRRT